MHLVFFCSLHYKLSGRSACGDVWVQHHHVDPHGSAFGNWKLGYS